ncbi:MAG TPA: macro domain-containing protein [Polyangiaceae bacterium]|nr:macro domain-containing protein [Polyangiaceae bacterium]
MIKFVTGNLLDAKVDALVNTVNTAGVMGKGLALQFKKAFPANAKAYEASAKAGEIEVGKMFVFEAGGIVLPRYIINFPTKKHWRSPSRLEYIDAGLVDLVAVIRDRKVRSIAIPPLGAGLGGLAWHDVRHLIERALAELTDVDVLVFEPNGAPAPEEMRNATAKPKMTQGRAAVLALMNRYLVPGYDYRLSLLEVQKLAYFLQVAGEPLKLEYRPNVYGPYADNLRHVLHHIEGHYVRGFGDGKNTPETPLELIGDAAAEAEAFLADRWESQARLAEVAALIEGYETSYGMELLSSVHWVATHNADAAASADETVQAVHAWTDRKATTMKPEQIRAAWAHLNERNWLSRSLPSSP